MSTRAASMARYVTPRHHIIICSRGTHDLSTTEFRPTAENWPRSSTEYVQLDLDPNPLSTQPHTVLAALNFLVGLWYGSDYLSFVVYRLLDPYRNETQGHGTPLSAQSKAHLLSLDTLH